MGLERRRLDWLRSRDGGHSCRRAQRVESSGRYNAADGRAGCMHAVGFTYTSQDALYGRKLDPPPNESVPVRLVRTS